MDVESLSLPQRVAKEHEAEKLLKETTHKTVEEVNVLSKNYPSLKGIDKTLVEVILRSYDHLATLVETTIRPVEEYFHKKYCHACDYYGDEDDMFLCIRQDIQCPLKIMFDIVDEL